MSDFLTDFLTTLIATIAVGSLYGLIALGYTLVYGVLKFINFAHSDIFVLGAWTSFTGATVALVNMGGSAESPPLWLGPMILLLAVAVCGLTGFCVERFAYRPLRRAPRLNVLITAIGVSLLLQNLGQLPGWPVARGPDRIVTKSADALTAAERASKPEIVDGIASLRLPGDAVATVPFGATPKSMPRLLPDAVLNTSTVTSGTASGGSRRGVIRLDQSIELQDGRSYRLVLTRFVDGQPRTETLSIDTRATGRIEAGSDIATQPRRSAEEVDGAAYRLIRSPRVPVQLVDVLIVISAVSLMLFLEFLVYRTRFGAAMRAASFNIDNASLMGINVNLVISITFVLGTSLAASAAFLYPMKYPGLNQPAHGIWVLLGLKAFVAAVVGGIGNVRGAVLGGFLIAAIEFFGALYISTQLRDVYVFSVLILVLLVRPGGLLGSVAREKV